MLDNSQILIIELLAGIRECACRGVELTSMSDKDAGCVFSWILDSFGRFNNAISEVARSEEKNQSGSKWIFTGSKYCHDASQAYKQAIRTKYPSMEEMEYVTMKVGRFHEILKFNVSGRNYFLDATYGQIIDKPNTLVLDDISKLGNYYHPDILTDDNIDTIRQDDEVKEVLDGKLCITPESSTFCRMKKVNINGREYQSLKDYLAEVLLLK